MSGASSSNGWIARPAQVRALASPVRQAIVDAMETGGPCTMSELAALLGAPSDGLYFHVRRLLKVGLLVELEPRREGRHVAAVYDLAFRPMRLSYRPPVAAKDLTAVVAAALRQAGREFGAAAKARISANSPAPAGRSPELWGARARGWLSDEEIAKVNALLEQALDVVRRARHREGARGMSLSFALCPTAKGRRTNHGGS